jgi:hypothetical protein
MYAELGTETEHLTLINFSFKNEPHLSTLVSRRFPKIQPSRESPWLIPTLISSGITLLLCILCYTLRKHLRKIPKICFSEATPEHKVPSIKFHTSSQAEARQTTDCCSRQSSQDGYFATYSTQATYPSYNKQHAATRWNPRSQKGVNRVSHPVKLHS